MVTVIILVAITIKTRVAIKHTTLKDKIGDLDDCFRKHCIIIYLYKCMYTPFHMTKYTTNQVRGLTVARFWLTVSSFPVCSVSWALAVS